MPRLLAGACTLALSLVVCNMAAAGESPPQSPSSSKLKWHSRGVPIKPEPIKPEVLSAETPPDATVADSSPTVPGILPKSPAAAPLARRLPPRASRSRLRDAVMQVSGAVSQETPSDAAPRGNATSEELPESPATRGPSSSEPLPTDSEPAPLQPALDPFADEPIPTPPQDDRPAPLDRLPAGDLSEGISTAPADVGCADYGAECRRAIADLQSHGIDQIVVGLVIDGVEGEDFPCDCKLGVNVDAPVFPGRNFSRTCFAWKATGTCHKPLYFEDVQLERYGHSWNPVLQPFMSAAHFFVSVPLLPYKMGLNPPCECMYTLGYYRPGSCAPYVFEPIPLSLRAAIYEALGITGFAFIMWPG
jgi:hypothetical protein